MIKKKLAQNIALFIALLFHVCGLIGILFTSYKDWFIQNTPVNLLVMAILIVITHPKKNKQFIFFLLVAFLIGFTSEVIGVNTGILFGHYTYGNILGLKFFNVPLIIGLNWFIIIYCAGMITQSYENYMLNKLAEKGLGISRRMMITSFIVDAGLLVLLFDWIMEPVALKLGFWQWQHNSIPMLNYVCWVIISVLLLAIFRKLDQNSRNIFAVHLFIIQLLFFLVLRTFL